MPHQCLHWPVRAVERYQGPFDKTHVHPVLISANTVRTPRAAVLAICAVADCVQSRSSTQYDPITPLTGAELLAGLLGQNAVLVRKNGFGVRWHVFVDNSHD